MKKWVQKNITKTVCKTFCIVCLPLISSFVVAETNIIHKDGNIVVIDKMQCTQSGGYYYETDKGAVNLVAGDICVGDACLVTSFEGTTNCDERSRNASTYSPKYYGVGKDELVIYGSNTVGAELMPAFIIENVKQAGQATERLATEMHLDTYFNIKDDKSADLFGVDIKARGSSTAFPALIGGIAEIGMASRPIKSSEVTKMQESGFDNMRGKGQEHVVALDGLVVIVSPNNPVKQLTMEQVASIFSGEIKNWSEVGGKDAAIKLYSKDSKSGTFDTFKGLVLKPNGKKLAKSAKLFESN